MGDGFFGFMAQVFLGLDVLIAIAMICDQVTRGRVHPVYWIAIPLMLASQLLSSAIYHSPSWIPIALYLIS
jgi:hypothetical protein